MDKHWLGEYNPGWDKRIEPGKCRQDIFKKGKPIVLFKPEGTIGEVDEWVKTLGRQAGVELDWYSAGDFGVILFLDGEKAYERLRGILENNDQAFAISKIFNLGGRVIRTHSNKRIGCPKYHR